MGKKTSLQILPLAELEQKSTKRLLNILGGTRAVISHIRHYAGPRCCEVCHEYIGSDWEGDVELPSQPFVEYQQILKSILETREHVPSKGQTGRNRR